MLVDGDDRAERLARALAFFHPRPEVVSAFLADDGQLYDGFGPERGRVQRRLRTLQRVDVGGPCVVVASARASLQRVPDRSARKRGTLVLRPGQRIERDDLVRQLLDAGYLSAPTASISGSLAVRGDVVDIWPSGVGRPVRVDFFDDEVESIRALHPDHGRPTGTLSRVLLLPAREERMDADAIARATVWLERAVREQQRGVRLRRRVLEDLRAGVRFSGIEDWLPALVPTVVPAERFADLGVMVYEPGDVLAAGADLLRQARQRWELLDEEERPLVPPEERFGSIEQLRALVERGCQVWGVPAADAVRFEVERPEGFGIRGRDLGPAAARLRALVDREVRVGITVDGEEQAETLVQLLHPHGVHVERARAPSELERGRVAVLIGDLPHGFVAPSSGWAFISAHVLFGGRGRAHRERLHRVHALFEGGLTDLAKLRPGDGVIHRRHGVGRYVGLRRVRVGDTAQDFVTLEYRGGDTLMLPATRLADLSPYEGPSKGLKLDRLGGQTWSRRKGKVRDKLLRMARELLQLHARRELVVREPADPPGPLYAQVVARFEHEETPDQIEAIRAVHEDLDRPWPMDRLLAGDVGFGKTEVALRAAIRMVESGRQVAVLVPTTVLAYQHFNTWRARLDGLGIRVEMLCRFVDARKRREILRALAAGDVHIVIGTTQLLGARVRYAELGLVVIDEEHRFGVRQKEKLRQLRTAVDVLSMSATPIPRTLQQALGGIRDMSVMLTPPTDRLAVATSVARLSESRVRSAIEAELERGGQVFVIHNRVETIGRFAEQIARWVPRVRLGVAHGQMKNDELERVLVRFIEREIDVLVSTAIVETGVDLPNVNTLLVDRADRFGLAQLYQLRGRVGRSSVRARCLLLVPEVIPPEARRRLQVLVENTELGSGFRVASADLELRGGGNLLGAEQSGQIAQVGHDVWVELLEEAIAEARGEEAREAIEPDLQIPADRFIPEDAVPDMRARLSWYKRFSSARDEVAIEAVLDDLEVEIGSLPVEVQNLAGFHRCVLACRRLGIERCRWLKIRAELELHRCASLDDALEAVVARYPRRFRRLRGSPSMVEFRFTPREAEQPFRTLRWALAQLERAARGDL